MYYVLQVFSETDATRNDEINSGQQKRRMFFMPIILNLHYDSNYCFISIIQCISKLINSQRNSISYQRTIYITAAEIIQIHTSSSSVKSPSYIFMAHNIFRTLRNRNPLKDIIHNNCLMTVHNEHPCPKTIRIHYS